MRVADGVSGAVCGDDHPEQPDQALVIGHEAVLGALEHTWAKAKKLALSRNDTFNWSFAAMAMTTKAIRFSEVRTWPGGPTGSAAVASPMPPAMMPARRNFSPSGLGAAVDVVAVADAVASLGEDDADSTQGANATRHGGAAIDPPDALLRTLVALVRHRRREPDLVASCGRSQAGFRRRRGRCERRGTAVEVLDGVLRDAAAGTVAECHHGTQLEALMMFQRTDDLAPVWFGTPLPALVTPPVEVTRR